MHRIEATFGATVRAMAVGMRTDPAFYCSRCCVAEPLRGWTGPRDSLRLLQQVALMRARHSACHGSLTRTDATTDAWAEDDFVGEAQWVQACRVVGEFARASAVVATSADQSSLLQAWGAGDDSAGHKAVEALDHLVVVVAEQHEQLAQVVLALQYLRSQLAPPGTQIGV